MFRSLWMRGVAGNSTPDTLILNTGAPQGCMLSPLLYSLFTHDCGATHASNSIIKFADDTTVVGILGVQITKDLKWTTHSHSREEGVTVPLPHQEVEKVRHGPLNPQKVVQLCH